MTVYAGRKFNLLILDDDPDIVRLVSKLLQDSLSDRLQLTALTDTNEAKKWLEENCCDILLSDIEMPDTNGLEMLKIAKSRNAWTQVIFLTGHSTWKHLAEAIEHGATDYLLKPIQREELINLVSIECDRLARWQDALAKTLHSASI